MMRTDGNFTIYILQTRWGGKVWDIERKQFRDVKKKPDEWHYTSQFCTTNQKLTDEFSASGEVWQKTGIHGVFDLEIAIKALLHIAKCNPHQAWRLAKLEISQKISPAHITIIPEDEYAIVAGPYNSYDPLAGPKK